MINFDKELAYLPIEILIFACKFRNTNLYSLDTSYEHFWLICTS